jgi:hypothetical protein
LEKHLERISKVSLVVILHSKYTGALTFENLCLGDAAGDEVG